MTALPQDLQGMCQLVVDLAPALHFGLGSERGPGWAVKAIQATTEGRDQPVLSLWQMPGQTAWRFHLRNPEPGAECPRGFVRDRDHLAELLRAVVPTAPSIVRLTVHPEVYAGVLARLPTGDPQGPSVTLAKDEHGALSPGRALALMSDDSWAIVDLDHGRMVSLGKPPARVTWGDER